MDFDEYEYLENTVENPELKKLEDKVNGGDGKVEYEEKDRSRSSKQRSDEDGDDFDRHSKRLRSRSHSERHQHERGRESRDMEPIDKDFKERRKEMESRNGDRETRRYKEKKDETQPEADPERDQRTVFAYQISLKASERDVYEFFSMAGKVRDVQLIMDRNSRRSKGVGVFALICAMLLSFRHFSSVKVLYVGYIEFYDSMSVPMAIAMSGQLLLGLPVMVKPSEAEKNLVQPTPVATGGLGPYSGGARRLYVGNLPVTIKEDQLRQVFESFGAVELVQMPSDPGTGTCKGYAFVQFARLEDAKAAQNLNGQLEIAGRVIKVSAITDQAGMQEAGANFADFDDDEGNGLSLNAQSRALLMQKLDRTGTASSISGSSAAPVLGQPSFPVLTGLTTAGLAVPSFAAPSIDPIGAPTECLLLKNMFDPNAEAEPDFDMDIKEDVQDECSKFGTLKHIYVEKHSAGFVYLRFENTESAVGAQRALHGRWFAGKMITATFMTFNVVCSFTTITRLNFLIAARNFQMVDKELTFAPTISCQMATAQEPFLRLTISHQVVMISLCTYYGNFKIRDFDVWNL
ncbi:hypothetical protein BUALT_Bualt15G0006800 [Buddleja alternifolia]|uniref:RRM domain-containing protein n=1 Tax=Buddleja alternifolia TaxID=168488 RepID=A0AAV6WI22_9LAMI|nr:hypothetical protein BUALT_Bualt15G0006800 [Buddleja alternifolia]